MRPTLGTSHKIVPRHGNSTTSLATIEALRKSFSTFGLPETIVSDNATTFTSSEFSEFVKKNGIRHIFTPPYHPASNGLVERAVQTFKEGMRRNKEGSLNTRLSRFLFRYRLTPHSTTGVPPSELMFGRKLRSPLDLLKPSIGSTVRQAQDRQKKAQDSHASPRTVGVGDNVYARNYREGLRWLPGRVVQMEGAVLAQVQLPDGHILRRHVDQLRPRSADPEDLGVTESKNPEGEDGLEAIVPNSSQTSTEQPESQQDSEATRRDEGEEVPNELASESTDTSNQDRMTHDQENIASQGEQRTVRRSSRTRHPPERYDELNY